jgi:Ca2+-binding EF-hand superfamily protein
VDVAEFASGFSLLGAGSKSDKLALAFQMFDTDEDGRLTRRQMWKYLRSFLIVLLKLSRGFQSMDEDIMDCANNGAVACTRMVFSQANLEVKTKISFEEFAAWYTDGGYTLIPWLELLDLKKWSFSRPIY